MSITNNLGEDIQFEINSVVKDNPNGQGVCLWGGVTKAYLLPKKRTNAFFWENQAVLDFNNQALPIMEALN